MSDVHYDSGYVVDDEGLGLHLSDLHSSPKEITLILSSSRADPMSLTPTPGHVNFVEWSLKLLSRPFDKIKMT